MTAILDVAMRYLHIVSAVLAVGGMAFVLLCLTPAVHVLDDATRKSVMDFVHGRFLRVVWFSIAGLTLSGIYNWVNLADVYKAMGAKGNALIGTKVLLAIILFAIVFCRSIGLIGPQRQRTVLMINIHLAAIIILLGSILRFFRLQYG